MKDYNAKAIEDAWDMADNFLEDIITQAVTGEVSNDLFNDYERGDEYHHSSHVDKEYSLLEAATLLDQLSSHEETDYGLWEGVHDPRQAVGTQAAYTYGNAVMYYWNNVIEEINEFLNMWEWDTEAERKEGATKFITTLVVLNQHFERSDADSMVGASLDDIKNMEWTSTLVLCDWLDEHNGDMQLTKKLRTLLS